MRQFALQTFALGLSCGVAACSGSDAQPTGAGALEGSGVETYAPVTSQGATTPMGAEGSGASDSGGTAAADGAATAGNEMGDGATGDEGTSERAPGEGATFDNATGDDPAGGDGSGQDGAGEGNTGESAAGDDGAGDDASGTSTAGADPAAEPDCNAPMPGSGQQRAGNGRGGEGNLSWEIWSNTGQGELTTYDVPAFVASWDEAGGYLGRMGFEWGGFGDTPVPHEQRGTIRAQFVSNRSGTAGIYSYVGMYGWTTDPCVEWYVVDDSYNRMPINPGNTTNMGEVDIDGGTYVVYTRPTAGTGGSRCSGVNDWIQYYSVRTTARACGVISLTEHFNAWQSLGMDMSGNLLEAKILLEVGGGTGRVEFPVANVTTTP